MKASKNAQWWGPSEMKLIMVQLFKRTVGQYLLNPLISHNPSLTLIFTETAYKLYTQKNLHISVYSRFIHNYLNIETTKMDFRRKKNL